VVVMDVFVVGSCWMCVAVCWWFLFADCCGSVCVLYGHCLVIEVLPFGRQYLVNRGLPSTSNMVGYAIGHLENVFRSCRPPLTHPAGAGTRCVSVFTLHTSPLPTNETIFIRTLTAGGRPFHMHQLRRVARNLPSTMLYFEIRCI
jgi:hypothetical protein